MYWFLVICLSFLTSFWYLAGCFMLLCFNRQLEEQVFETKRDFSLISIYMFRRYSTFRNLCSKCHSSRRQIYQLEFRFVKLASSSLHSSPDPTQKSKSVSDHSFGSNHRILKIFGFKFVTRKHFYLLYSCERMLRYTSNTHFAFHQF